MKEKKLTKSDLNKMFVRSCFLLGSFNFERMQSIGFCVTLIPAIKRLYSKKEDQKEALKRHLEFFNTQPFISAPIMGVTAAMEEQKASGQPIDNATISGVKVGLMGPLAGVGDPIYWGLYARFWLHSEPQSPYPAALSDRFFSSFSLTLHAWQRNGTV